MSARRIATAVLAAALMGGGLAAVAAPAEAANPRCMSRAEYRAIKPGQTPAKVARIVGRKGRVGYAGNTGGYRYLNWEFKTCTRYGWGSVSFSAEPGKSLRVDGKSVAW